MQGQSRSGSICTVCQARTYAFDRARSYAEYEGALVRAIVTLKFEQIEPLGAWFAQAAGGSRAAGSGKLEVDIVVPVPLHRQRYRERGYNQADLIARPLARQLGLPYRAVLLMRTRPRPDKHILSLRGALGFGPWRFCHTSGQPS